MVRRLLKKLQFSIKNLLVLVLGIAIGFSLNAYTLQLRWGRPRSSASTSAYKIEAADELRISVTGKRLPQLPAVTGKYVVQEEGTIDVKPYGEVDVAGLTVPEAATAIEHALKDQIELPMAMVEVSTKNSRYFYVVIKTPGQEDAVTKLRVGSGQTVLGAIKATGAVAWPTTSQIWIERASPNGAGPASLLPITTGAPANPTSIQNCGLLPGDRLTISNPPVPQ